MNDNFLVGVLSTLSVIFALTLTWAICHAAIANECKKQGSFYVGDDIYDCKLRTRS